MSTVNKSIIDKYVKEAFDEQLKDTIYKLVSKKIQESMPMIVDELAKEKVVQRAIIDCVEEMIDNNEFLEMICGAMSDQALNEVHRLVSKTLFSKEAYMAIYPKG